MKEIALFFKKYILTSILVMRFRGIARISDKPDLRTQRLKCGTKKVEGGIHLCCYAR